MSEWHSVALADIADIRFSNVDKKTITGEIPVRLCNYMDVYTNSYVTQDLPFMDATATALEIERFKVEQGDNILTKDSETPDDIGIPAVVKDEITNLVCGYHLSLIKPKLNKVDPVYLSKQLGSKQSSVYFSRLANGSTRYGLSSSAIASVRIPLPPLAQQRHIAKILSTLDTAIEKTESLIAKYQQIKAGLMYDLFTRGVTADGKLRPLREQAPELYNETPIGWIPKEGECKTLEQLLAPVGNTLRSGPFGSALLKDELVEEGIPFLGIDNIYTEHFEAKYKRFVSQKKFMELYRYSVRPKDVVITIMGTVGRCCVLPDDIGQALSSKHLWTMTLDQSQVFPELVCWQLNYAPWVLSWFRRESQGAVMDAIQSSTLRTLRLLVPRMSKQEEILGIYLASTSKIDSEISELKKLKKKKTGLMHDLLTGRVRVKAINPQDI